MPQISLYMELDLILFCIEIIVLVLHFMLLYFLIQMRRKNKSYQSPFYIVTIFIFINDIIYVINMDVCAKLARYKNMRFLYTDDSYIPTLVYFISAYTSHAEIFGHTVIAINRYVVFRDMLKTNINWSKKKTICVLCGLILLPFGLQGYRLFFRCKYTFSDSGENTITYINPVVAKIVSYVNLNVYIINVIPQLVASVMAFLEYRKFAAKRIHLNELQRHEYKLFVHSFLMFACFAGRVIYQFLLLFASYTKNQSLLKSAQTFFPIIGSTYSLLGSVFLMIISNQVRHDFLVFFRLKTNRVNPGTTSLDLLRASSYVM